MKSLQMLFISASIHGRLNNYKNNNNKITLTIVIGLRSELSRTSEISAKIKKLSPS